MVRVTEELAISPEAVTLYYTSDPLLGHLPVLAFHGPSTTANFTLNSSRIQVHVYSPAGFQSFPRLTISPNSPLYGVVAHLPREFQGDEVCRGLAFALFKYFSELSEPVKAHLRNQYPTTRGRRPGSAPALFGEQHAADLAKAMARAENNTADFLHILQSALQTQHMSNLDLDLVLPPGTVTPLRPEDLETAPDDDDDVILDPTLRQYDRTYMPLVKLFGDPVFLPTSKLRRAPSRPSSLNHRSKTFTKDQKVELRMKLGELVDTEERYVLKLNELVKHVADSLRQNIAEDEAAAAAAATIATPPSSGRLPTSDELDQLFPRSVDRILQVNTAFMQELRRVMDESEEDAVRDLDVPYTFGSASSRHAVMAGPAGASLARGKDPSGALAMARSFLEWFPQFTDCYQDYIRASQYFPHLLSTFLDGPSKFRERLLQTTGEQNLRSILIEPVQRLPRYSLLIDQIVQCLPINHPALQLMLKARDVITNICSMDDPLEDKPQVTNRLRNMVESWPLDLEPQGRLVLAADFVELVAPYDADAHASSSSSNSSTSDRAGLFILFSDCLVLVKKKPGSSMTGRDLLREIDKPSPAGLLASMTNAAGGPASYEVAFCGWHLLADVRFTESADGRLVWMTSTQEMKGAHAGEYVSSKVITSRCFLLQEAFEGKASRWSEDVVKARIEARFSEAERETSTWTLRSVRMPENNNVGFHAAVFQEAAEELIEGRREPAPVRIVLDNHRGTKGAPVGHYGVEIVVEVRTDGGRGSTGSRHHYHKGSYDDALRVTMTAVGLNGKKYSDDVDMEDFLPTLSRRIIQLASIQFNTTNAKLVPALVSYHTKTLRSLNFSARNEKTRSFLASSPVKLISSFLGGSTSNSTIGNNPAAQTSAPDVSTYGSVRGKRSQSQPGSLRGGSSRNQQQPPETGSLNGSIRDRDAGARFDKPRPENPLVRLEQTFTGYVAALQSRRGQFVGRMLLNRASYTAADELSVNQLYNQLNESPFNWETSYDMPPETVFTAFEKFARIAWRGQMGTIMTIQALDALQERAGRKVPGDFADFVNFLFKDMAPQNRRAFTALIKLLADLLSACSDDGDRGALTLAFAELLVADSGEPPHNYINLLDRLVEDCGRIFASDEAASNHSRSASFNQSGHLGSSLQTHGSIYDSFSSTTRSQKSATGSLTSNTSSIRRKFGLDSLLRQNSSSRGGGAGSNAVLEAMMAGGVEGGGEQERLSVWRSLSKHHRNPATGEASSLSKASGSSIVGRSRSIDMGISSPMGSKSLRRPVSRDRPPVAGAFDDMMRPPSSHRPTSSHQLETIGEPDGAETATHKPRPSQVPEKSLRKKRRSSLSDLKSLMAAASLEDSPMSPVPLQTTKPTSEKFNASPQPRTPSPSKISASKIPVSPPSQPHLSQVQRSAVPSTAAASPRQKENVAVPSTGAAAGLISTELPLSSTLRKAASTAGGTHRRLPSTATALSDATKQGGHAKTPSGPSQGSGPGTGTGGNNSHIPTLKTSRAAGTVLPPPKGRSGSASGASGKESPTRIYAVSSSGSPTKLMSPSLLPAPSLTLGANGSSSAAATPSGQKLRLQSPQKLRERLQTEKKAVGEADASLKTELQRISEDMARVNLGGNGGVGVTSGSSSEPRADGHDVQRLETSVRALEERLPQLLGELQQRQEALQQDMEQSVRASETKVRGIDQLYKEAMAENELLYEKFNLELGKIVKALKGKGREDKEDLVAKLKEQSEETARLRKDNARLRREAVSLRTMIKGGDA